ncbi:patatin-like phospholipase family protein [Clostridium tetani]|uniref:patatin-like phospholipase family protein n=1 Tax=Clostridium tetani TaxID=1513 RepID=UPI0024A8DBE5|nr:patatin family protein [Clostridium tetani]
MDKVGLILEGGGMRGLYTAGILDCFMEKEFYAPYVIGVSMGACNATSYISKQKDRNRAVVVNYVNDPRYIGIKNIFRCKSLLGIDLIYDEIPNTLEPFDYKTFYASKQKFIIVATDCKTGKPIYFNKDKDEDILTTVRASSSLPFISPIVRYNDMELLDGGIADSIPIGKSIKDGNIKNIIILTRPKGYRKDPFRRKRLLKRFYSGYNNLIKAVEDRYRIYNRTLDYIEKLEEENKVFILRPTNKIKVRRIEKNTEKLESLYKMGFEDAEKQYDKMIDWVNNA